MLKAKGLPGMFWGEAVNCAVYLLNRTLSKSTRDRTPYELWTGSRPVVSHLSVFDCIAHVKATQPSLKKLDDRSIPMIFVGYELGSAAYRCYNPVTKRVHISRDVILDEEATWNSSGVQSTEMEYDVSFGDQPEIFQTMRMELRTGDVTGAVATDPRAHDAGSVWSQRGSERHDSLASHEFRSPAAGGGLSAVSAREDQHQTPPSYNLDADHDDAPLRYRQLSEMLGPGSLPGQAKRILHQELMLVKGEEPATFSKTKGDQAWKQAMKEEMDSIEENQT
jgi:hypothetical protein